MPRLFMADPAQVIQTPTAPGSSFGAGVGASRANVGDAVSALGKIMAEYASSRSRAAATAFKQDLTARANEISLNPNIEERLPAFEAAKRELHDQYRPSWANGMPNEFDSEAGFASESVRLSLVDQTMKDGIAQTRENTELDAQYRIQEAAKSGDEHELELSYLEAQAAFRNASLAYTPAEQMMAFQKVVGGGLRTLTEMHPKTALKYIDKMGSMLGPEVQSVYRSEAIANIKQAAAEDVSRRSQERTLRLQAEQDASDAAEEELVQLDANGALTAADVKARVKSGALDADSGRLWLDRVRNPPGGEGGGSLDRDLYNSFSERLDRGEYITSEVNTAFKAGRLDKASRDSLVNRSTDIRFNRGRDYIRTALDPRANPNDTNASTKLAQANLFFDEWVSANPNATGEQAMAVAQRQVEGAKASYSNREKPKELIRPVGYVASKNEKGVETVDIDASADVLDQMLADGTLDTLSYRQEVSKLRKISDAQDRQAEVEARRKAAQAQQAGE